MILLDTHALVWLLVGDHRLGAQARAAADAAFRSGFLAVSAITFWEVAMLCAKGRLQIDEDIRSWRLALVEAGLLEMPIDGDIAVQAAELASLHGDPADRIIVATARTNGATLITADERILGWTGHASRSDARR